MKTPSSSLNWMKGSSTETSSSTTLTAPPLSSSRDDIDENDVVQIWREVLAEAVHEA